MPSPAGTANPGLATFLASLRGNPVETSIEQLVSLLKRRQIRNSQPCAIATAHLLRRVLRAVRVADIAKLLERVQQVGQRLIAAQPRELAIGNVVRRVLGLIRDEAEENRDGEVLAAVDMGRESCTAAVNARRDGTSESTDTLDSRHNRDTGPLPKETSNERPPVLNHQTSYAASTKGSAVPSLFSFAPSKVASPLSTPGTQTPGSESPVVAPVVSTADTTHDLIAEVVEGVQEVIDELNQADDQIAGYALDHIHTGEVVLTHTPSMTVQKFFLKAAAKRKFTVVYAETFPIGHQAAHVTGITDDGGDEVEGNSERFLKSMTMAGVTVLLVPFSAVFALMSRINKVVLDTHVVSANGGLVAAAGAKIICKAANVHHTPVVVLSGVYKLSPVYPFNVGALIGFGDPKDVIGSQHGGLTQKVNIENPLFDYVPANLVDLYITNLGGHAPSYLYRIVADHYRSEDLHFMGSELE
ncbi:MAG: hypothetical protein Q9182_003724 [Xanthomendoza sp. 2 TL-2023]